MAQCILASRIIPFCVGKGVVVKEVNEQPEPIYRLYLSYQPFRLFEHDCEGSFTPEFRQQLGDFRSCLCGMIYSMEYQFAYDVVQEYNRQLFAVPGIFDSDPLLGVLARPQIDDDVNLIQRYLMRDPIIAPTHNRIFDFVRVTEFSEGRQCRSVGGIIYYASDRHLIVHNHSTCLKPVAGLEAMLPGLLSGTGYSYVLCPKERDADSPEDRSPLSWF